ncbi:Tetratricopeptide repeat (TPR)-like superfamily protein [Euphorbia peplus]|nr:Tetratricopeptide repeat (TPR)-like superfamily protein [Euphorbia peplus]
MVTILHPPSFQTPTIYAARSKKGRKQRQEGKLQKQQLHLRRNKPILSFPKSSPTPLLIDHKPYTQTKIEALDSILKDLESSIKNRLKIDPQIFSSLLETCYTLNAIGHGIRIHRLIPPSLLRRNAGISAKLLRLYASNGLIEEAQQGFHEDAIALYFQMEEEGIEPDQFTFPRVLKACGGLGLIRIGEAVHRDVIRFGFSDDGFVLNSLVDMYAKCGDIVKARKIFDDIGLKDPVSWNSMLSGYIRHELFVEALDIFNWMIQDGVELDSVAISSILANVCSLKLGIQIHGWVVQRGMIWDISVANSLIVMYSSNGELDQACSVFDQMPERDVVSWNSIISANSKDYRALAYFERMEEDNVTPDSITFVSTLSACAHLGLVEEGKRLFLCLREKYEIEPIMEHYACMVNLYGRAGLIREAYGVIVEKMEFDAGETVWGALLYACYLHGDVEVGEIAAQNLFELEPDNEHNFELLMKIYGDAGRLEDIERVRQMMVDRGL